MRKISRRARDMLLTITALLSMPLLGLGSELYYAEWSEGTVRGVSTPWFKNLSELAPGTYLSVVMDTQSGKLCVGIQANGAALFANGAPIPTHVIFPRGGGHASVARACGFDKAHANANIIGGGIVVDEDPRTGQRRYLLKTLTRSTNGSPITRVPERILTGGAVGNGAILDRVSGQSQALRDNGRMSLIDVEKFGHALADRFEVELVYLSSDRRALDPLAKTVEYERVIGRFGLTPVLGRNAQFSNGRVTFIPNESEVASEFFQSGKGWIRPCLRDALENR